ncbi:DUF6988 family protein [Variovorax guangxiensis]|uniref:DUF6988 family protein n=1 Tax=Variovorax guangxiensis TaxID=1775474 RepID=UPI002856E935|nr:hypothetical protein [Variovorax guangxiensis]MDR6855310.1 hypothetical protein [Variovorax guangxiensis]
MNPSDEAAAESESADDRLDQLLQQCEVLDEDVAKLLRKCDAANPRAVLSLALCHAAFEHAVSQRVLISAGLTGTALALCRLHFEAVVRAAWIRQGASKNWLKAFTTAVEGEGHKEPIMGPPIPSMLDAFEKHAPHVAAEFRKLYGTIEGMHSFVHGGSQTVAHALMGGYPADKLASALRNRNLLLVYTANCAIVAAESAFLRPRFDLLKEKHGAAMPPTASTQAAP